MRNAPRACSIGILIMSCLLPFPSAWAQVPKAPVKLFQEETTGYTMDYRLVSFRGAVAAACRTSPVFVRFCRHPAKGGQE